MRTVCSPVTSARGSLYLFLYCLLRKTFERKKDLVTATDTRLETRRRRRVCPLTAGSTVDLPPLTCRTFLGLGQQIQMPQPLPDVGTSVPQVKSGYPPPHRYTVGRPDRLSPALWSHHSDQRAAWKGSPEFVHWPGRPLITLLGSQGVL